jgi:single-strand DNA-binding protein
MDEQKKYFDVTGRLTKDITIRYTNTGKMIASSSIAVNMPKENVRFFDIIAWEDEAKKIEHLKKGQKISASGTWKDKEFTLKSGEKKQTVELTAYQIIIIDTVKKSEARRENIQKKDTVIDDPWVSNDNIPF